MDGLYSLLLFPNGLGLGVRVRCSCIFKGPCFSFFWVIDVSLSRLITTLEQVLRHK